MARSTLPEFDPLDQLGITPLSAAERPEPQAPARTVRRAAVPTRPAAPAIAVGPPASALVPAEPEGGRRAATQADQEMPVSPPETAAVREPWQARVSRPGLRLAGVSETTQPARKAKTSGRISADIWEEVRDCVVFHGHRMTIDSFTEDAFREHLRRLRKEKALGERFPARGHEPKQGRRVS